MKKIFFGFIIICQSLSSYSQNTNLIQGFKNELLNLIVDSILTEPVFGNRDIPFIVIIFTKINKNTVECSSSYIFNQAEYEIVKPSHFFIVKEKKILVRFLKI